MSPTQSGAEYPAQTIPSDPAVIMPPTAAHRNHGRTIAGWALFWFVAVGAVFVGIGLTFGPEVLIKVGAVIAVIGLIVSPILRAMGYGQPVPPRVDPKL